MKDDFRTEDQGSHLTDGAWELLLGAAGELTDAFRDDDRALQGGTVSFADTVMSDYLPPLHLIRYDARFAERFLNATEVVATKLKRAREQGWSYPSEGLLNSVAEEIAMEAILQMAEALIDVDLENGQLTDETAKALRDHVEEIRDIGFEDRDFEWLFRPEVDGIAEDSEIAPKMGFANLGFEDWFKPFRQDWDPLAQSDKRGLG